LRFFHGANELNGLAEIIYSGKFPIFAFFAIEYQFVTANGVPAERIIVLAVRDLQIRCRSSPVRPINHWSLLFRSILLARRGDRITVSVV